MADGSEDARKIDVTIAGITYGVLDDDLSCIAPVDFVLGSDLFYDNKNGKWYPQDVRMISLDR